jgi:hypothetical protein
MLQKLDITTIETVIKDDPVRPHIPAEWRNGTGSEVYGLWDEDFTRICAVVCVHYMDTVPTSEPEMLQSTGDSVAVFYTVWSYSRGSGREIIFSVADHIKQTRPTVKRYVTLSPLTDMAERFHLRNGATLIGRYDTAQNFEYHV